MFQTKDIITPSLGRQLKELREENGVSLDNLIKNTKIRKKYLILLEEERYDKLPADVYVKGYLQIYAKYFDLDFNLLFNQYKKERDLTNNLTNVSNNPKPARQLSFIITPKKITIIITLFVIMLSIGYFFYQIAYLTKAPILEVTEPKNDFETSENVIKLSGIAEPADILKINGKRIYIEKTGQWNDTITINDGLNELSIISTNQFGKSTIIKRRIYKK